MRASEEELEVLDVELDVVRRAEAAQRVAELGLAGVGVIVRAAHLEGA